MKVALHLQVQSKQSKPEWENQWQSDWYDDFLQLLSAMVSHWLGLEMSLSSSVMFLLLQTFIVLKVNIFWYTWISKQYPRVKVLILAFWKYI